MFWLHIFFRIVIWVFLKNHKVFEHDIRNRDEFFRSKFRSKKKEISKI